MKLTKQQLKRIIKEELGKVIEASEEKEWSTNKPCEDLSDDEKKKVKAAFEKAAKSGDKGYPAWLAKYETPCGDEDK